MKNYIRLMLFLAVYGVVNQTYCQTQEKTIKLIIQKINEEYIFPEMGTKVVSEIGKRINDNKYTHLNYKELANLLTSDLQEITKDLHFRVFYDPNPVIKEELTEKEKEADRLRSVNSSRNENFGFEKLEILKGNIGYLKFNYFSTWEEANSTVHSAMNFLSNSRAIIIDLRDNGGGDTRMIQTIYSYLSGTKREHLYSIFHRKGDKEEQYWTIPHLPGRRSPNTPIYVLTSRNTFSAAEALAYAIKHKKRGIIIGETTAGGAHPIKVFDIANGFSVMIPIKRAILPETNSNWEKVGVIPNVKISADKAFDKAYLMAIRDQISLNDEKQQYYVWIRNRLEALIDNITILSQAELKKYVGAYEHRIIEFKDGKLYYKREGVTPYQIIPMGFDRFLIKEKLNYIIEFNKNSNNKIDGLKLIFDDGTESKSKKTK